MTAADTRHTQVHGSVCDGFEAVREAFVENFALRNELGGACCVYRHGEKVVDLWGGIRNRLSGEPWEADTMVVVFSATKGLSAMTLAVAHSRGWLDYDDRISTYWPEFAQHDKESITVRQLLGHQAGLFAFNERVDKETVADLDRLAVVMARQKPRWEPGTRQAYHALSLGSYEGELLRRVDPQHRSLGQFFQEVIATPLGLDFYIRLPDSVPDSRLAVPDLANPLKMFGHMPLRFVLQALYPRSNIFRALVVNPGSMVVMDKERIYARNLEVPSGGGVGSAQGMARAYDAFLTGEALGLREETLQALRAPAVPPARGFFDECMKGEAKFSLGFMKSSQGIQFGSSASAFGSPGAGGSLGFADPDTGVAYAYVTNRMSLDFAGDARDIALRKALSTAIGAAL